MYQEILDTNGMMLLFLFYLSRPPLRLVEMRPYLDIFWKNYENQRQKFDRNIGCKVFLSERVLGWVFNWNNLDRKITENDAWMINRKPVQGQIRYRSFLGQIIGTRHCTGWWPWRSQYWTVLAAPESWGWALVADNEGWEGCQVLMHPDDHWPWWRFIGVWDLTSPDLRLSQKWIPAP